MWNYCQNDDYLLLWLLSGFTKLFLSLISKDPALSAYFADPRKVKSLQKNGLVGGGIIVGFSNLFIPVWCFKIISIVDSFTLFHNGILSFVGSFGQRLLYYSAFPQVKLLLLHHEPRQRWPSSLIVHSTRWNLNAMRAARVSWNRLVFCNGSQKLPNGMFPFPSTYWPFITILTSDELFRSLLVVRRQKNRPGKTLLPIRFVQ